MKQIPGRAWSMVARAVAVAALGCTLLAVSATAQGGGAQGSPEPAEVSPRPAVLGSGDSRSEGEGPGLVGSPVAIAVGVVLLGGITAAGTLIVLRVTGGRPR